MKSGWVGRHSQPNPYFRVVWDDNLNLVFNPTQSVKYGLGCRIVNINIVLNFFFRFLVSNGYKSLKLLHLNFKHTYNKFKIYIPLICFLLK